MNTVALAMGVMINLAHLSQSGVDSKDLIRDIQEATLSTTNLLAPPPKQNKRPRPKRFICLAIFLGEKCRTLKPEKLWVFLGYHVWPQHV